MKCEGGSEGVQCTRCIRLATICEFVPLRRFGRPRRLVPLVPKDDGSSTQALVASEVDDALFSPSDAPSKAMVMGGQSNAFASGSTPFVFDKVVSIPVGLPLSNMDPSLDDYDTLARLYLAQIHPFLPILSHHLPELSHYLRTSSPALSLSLYALLNVSDSSPGPLLTSGTTLADLQAQVIAVHCQYARGQAGEARETLRSVCLTLVGNSWHEIDSPAHPGHFGMSTSDVRSVRHLWWECWALDVLLAIVTGEKAYDLQGVAYQVQIGEPGDLDSPPALRIRALSLLVTCSQPPDSTASEAEVASRMQALSTVASNLSILAHQSYLTSCGSLSSTSPADLPNVLAGREAAFMASLIASASTIFLLSSSSYFSNLVASAFPCGLDTTCDAPLSAHHLINLATRNIFELLRTSLSPQLPAASHSPFFGCSLLVATQGRLLTLAKEVNEIGDWDRVGAISDIELAEWELAMQAKRWGVAQGLLKEVKSLRLAVCGVTTAPTLLLNGL